MLYFPQHIRHFRRLLSPNARKLPVCGEELREGPGCRRAAGSADTLEELSGVEVLVHTIPPEEPDWMLKGAVFVGHVLLSLLSLTNISSFSHAVSGITALHAYMLDNESGLPLSNFSFLPGVHLFARWIRSCCVHHDDDSARPCVRDILRTCLRMRGPPTFGMRPILVCFLSLLGR